MNACLGPATLLAASTVCSLSTTTSADADWDTQVSLTYLLVAVKYQYVECCRLLQSTVSQYCKYFVTFPLSHYSSQLQDATVTPWWICVCPSHAVTVVSAP